MKRQCHAEQKHDDGDDSGDTVFSLAAALGGGGGGGGGATSKRRKTTRKRTSTSSSATKSTIPGIVTVEDTPSTPVLAETQPQPKMRRVRRQQTLVSTGEASLKKMVRARQAEWDAFQKSTNALRERISKIEQQLRTIKRTRRNLRAYNEMLDKHTALQRELTTLEMNAPPIDEFFSDLKDFLKQRKDEENAQDAVSDAQSSLSNVSATATRDDQNNEPEQDAIAAVPVVPSHRSPVVTAGAPLFDVNQFVLLRLSRADLDNRRQMTVGASSLSNKGSDATLFDDVIARETRQHMCLDDAARPLLFVVSPTGCGKIDFSVPAQLSTDGSSVASTDAATTDQPIMVTIGKANRSHLPSNSSQNHNRLNVKMKDIRNMENMSMLNFVSTQERETTVEEEQHQNFVHFIDQRHAERQLRTAPRYDDPTCDACEQPLLVNVRTGIVTCGSCGLSYADGVDGHKWEAIEHVPHSKFEYLKSGHLMTLLKRRQAKENTVVPRDVRDQVLLQLAREKFDLRKVTPKKMKSTLRKLNQPKFYDHIWQLTYIVTGVKPFQFTELQEQEFQAVFDVLEEVYPLFKPKNAENFPFYWYIIRKTAQLLGHDEPVVRSFPLLKNPRKHLQKEKLWRKMMKHLNWPYIPSPHDRGD